MSHFWHFVTLHLKSNTKIIRFRHKHDNFTLRNSYTNDYFSMLRVPNICINFREEVDERVRRTS